MSHIVVEVLARTADTPDQSRLTVRCRHLTSILPPKAPLRCPLQYAGSRRQKSDVPIVGAHRDRYPIIRRSAGGASFARLAASRSDRDWCAAWLRLSTGSVHGAYEPDAFILFPDISVSS